MKSYNMYNKKLIVFVLFFYTATRCETRGDSYKLPVDYSVVANTTNTSDCWLRLHAPVLFDALEELNSKYTHALETVQEYLEKNRFDEKMLEEMIARQGAAYREITKATAKHIKIPSGMNLGGRCMMRMPDSILFFYRMKLRNDTHFRVNVLHNDIKNMVLRAHLSLHNLRLQGAYERAITLDDPSVIHIVPSFGEMHLLLKDVQYEVEGRYRAIKDGLVIEHVISQLKCEDIIASFNTTPKDENVIRLQKENLGDFTLRLKSDLNQWLKDYFNDYLLSSNFDDIPSFHLLEEYDKLKVAHLAAYTDNAIHAINARLKQFKGDAIKVPDFGFITQFDERFNLTKGEIRGLNTMYRRSVATTISKRDNLRYVDVTVGFSDLKVTYSRSNYHFTVSTDDTSSHLTLGLLREPEVVEIDIDFLEPLGPRSLSLGISRYIPGNTNYHYYQHHVYNIISNTLNYGVAMLKSIPRCVPFVPGQLNPRQGIQYLKFKTSDDNKAMKYPHGTNN